jgi:tetratricopeptide (TPR) repeat protein
MKRIILALGMCAFLAIQCSAQLPQWKLDSLIKHLNCLQLKAEFNFNFSMEELEGKKIDTTDSLTSLSDEELERKMKGVSRDAFVGEQMIYRMMGGTRQIPQELSQMTISRYEQYINENPKDSLAINRLVTLLITLRETDMAMTAVEYGIGQFPGYDALYFHKFNLLFSWRFELLKAEIFMKDALKKFPNNALLHFSMFQLQFSRHMMSKGKVESMDEILSNVTDYRNRNQGKLLPEFMFHFCRSYIYLVMKLSEADGGDDIKVFNTKTTNPSMDQHTKAFVSFIEKHQKSKAISDKLAHRFLTMCYVLLSDQKKALFHNQKEIDLTDGVERMQAEEGRLLIQIGGASGKTQMVQFIEAKYKRSPGPTDLLRIGTLYSDLDNKEKAREYFDRAVNENPTLGLAHQYQALQAFRDRRMTDAYRALQHARPYATDRVCQFLMEIIYSANEYGEVIALEELKELFKYQPDHETGLEFKAILEAKD